MPNLYGHQKKKKKWMTAIGRGKNVKHFMPEERLAYYNKMIVEEGSQITLTQNGTEGSCLREPSQIMFALRGG